MKHASPKQPTVLLIRGLPGSGKSTVAHALASELGPDNVIILDPDATDYSSTAYHEFTEKLRAEAVDEKFYPYRFLRAQAHEAIRKSKYVIWNQAFTNLDSFQKTVINLQKYAREQGTELSTLVVEIYVDDATARARVAERSADGGHTVSDQEFKRFIRDYTSFKDAGFSVVSVDGNKDVVVSVRKILDALAD